jgi:hypothetical protein
VLENGSNSAPFRVFVANLFDPMSSQADTYYTRTRRAIRTIHVAPVPNLYVAPSSPEVIDWPVAKINNRSYNCKKVLQSLSAVMRNLDGTLLTKDNRRLRDVYSQIMHAIHRTELELKGVCLIPMGPGCNTDWVLRYVLNYLFPQERLNDLSVWQEMDLSQTTFDADIFLFRYEDVSKACVHNVIPARLVCDLLTRRHILEYYYERSDMIPIHQMISVFFKGEIMVNNALDVLTLCEQNLKTELEEINKTIRLINEMKPRPSYSITLISIDSGQDQLFDRIRNLITPWVLKLREHFKNTEIESMSHTEYVHYTAAKVSDNVRSKDGRRVKDIMLLMCQSVMDHGMATSVKMNKLDDRLVKEVIFSRKEMDKLLLDSYKIDFTLESITFDPFLWAYQFNDLCEAYVYSDIPTSTIVLTPITHKVQYDAFIPETVQYHKALKGNDLNAYRQHQIFFGLMDLRMKTSNFDGEYHTILDEYADLSLDHLRMMCQYLLHKHAKWISKNVGKYFMEEKAMAKEVFGFYRVGAKILIQKAIDAFKKKDTIK